MTCEHRSSAVAFVSIIVNWNARKQNPGIFRGSAICIYRIWIINAELNDSMEKQEHSSWANHRLDIRMPCDELIQPNCRGNNFLRQTEKTYLNYGNCTSIGMWIMNKHRNYTCRAANVQPSSPSDAVRCGRWKKCADVSCWNAKNATNVVFLLGFHSFRKRDRIDKFHRGVVFHVKTVYTTIGLMSSRELR